MKIAKYLRQCGQWALEMVLFCVIFAYSGVPNSPEGLKHFAVVWLTTAAILFLAALVVYIAAVETESRRTITAGRF